MRLTARLFLTVALTTALILPVSLPALAAPPFAKPIAAKQAQAATVQAQVDALDTKAEIATEHFDAARGRYDKLAAEERAAQAHIDDLQARTSKLQRKLNTRVNSMYRQGPLGALNLLLSTDSIQQFVATAQALTEMSRRDSENVAQLKATKKQAVAAHITLIAARNKANRQQKAMASAAADVKAQAAAKAKMLAGLNADIKALLAKQKAAEEAAARARLLALLARERAAAAAYGRAHGSHDTGGGSWDIGGNPPTSGRGAQAVWWAEKAIGRPYVWGASGPRTFDCSGLVLWAYRHVGVHLPHHAASQIGHGHRVSRGNLQPGDLVFFGSPIHHVGMYVGGGDFIEAPHSGANVRVTSLNHRGDYAGACRP